VVAELVFRITESVHVFQRDVDATFGIVNSDVLPEVSQLQCGADGIGQFLSDFVSIPEQMQEEPADRVCRIVKISQQIVESLIASNSLILQKSGYEVFERLLGNVVLLDSPAQRYEYGMLRFALVTKVQFFAPPFEKPDGNLRITCLISQVIANSTVSIYVVNVLANRAGKQNRAYNKVLVVGSGKLLAQPLRDFRR
jgi:hypothetical protein